MPFAFLDGVSKMAKNTGFVEIHGTQTGVTMVSSRSREAITNVALNPKWLAVSRWTAKISTFKISRTDPSILFWIGYSKIRNYKNLLYVFCTYKKQYTCRKFWKSVFFLHSSRFISHHFLSSINHSWSMDYWERLSRTSWWRFWSQREFISRRSLLHLFGPPKTMKLLSDHQTTELEKIISMLTYT